MILEPFWKEALSQLKETLDESEFVIWFSAINFEASNENSITLSVPSSFFRDQIKQKYIPKLEFILEDLSGLKVEILIDIRNKNSKENVSPKEEIKVAIETIPLILKNKDLPLVSNKKKTELFLNEKYTLDSFVVGKNNDFAYSCAIAISNSPGTNYNPYLIYGGVGLGKTHLMQAIGNAIHKNNPTSNIIYVPAESFLNEFLHSIQTKTTNEFKNKYRKADVLLIDDIHDLQKKRETQEELFNTFNALYESKKQMVFTCDRPPQELKDFADRLLSRLTRGINADLHLPTWETRLIILKNKLGNKNNLISDPVLELIAKNVTTNIRDLESALNQILAYSDLLNREITLEVAQSLLKNTFAGQSMQPIPIDLIQKIVADSYDVGLQDIKGKKRTQTITLPRQIAMYLIRNLTEFSTTEVGLEFGGRDHTTVMHAVQKIEDKIKTEPEFESRIQNIIRLIRERSNIS